MAASLKVSTSADAGLVERMITMVETHSPGSRWTHTAKSVRGQATSANGGTVLGGGVYAGVPVTGTAGFTGNVPDDGYLP